MVKKYFLNNMDNFMNKLNRSNLILRIFNTYSIEIYVKYPLGI